MCRKQTVEEFDLYSMTKQADFHVDGTLTVDTADTDSRQQQQTTGSGSRSMVYYFTSNAVSPSAFIFVGKDKFESMVAMSLMIHSFHIDGSRQMRIS